MPPSTKRVQMALLALACAGGISCHHTTAHAAPPPAAPEPADSSNPAPTAPGGSATGANPAPATPPSKSAGTESSPPATPAPKPVEPKARPAAPAPAPSEAPAPKPAPPQITPRIPPAQEAEYKSQTQKSIAEAEANLRRTAGRQLNDVQHDMVGKIQSFLIQSREASEIPDWSRARILADKARLLSIELVESL